MEKKEGFCFVLYIRKIRFKNTENLFLFLDFLFVNLKLEENGDYIII